VTFQEHLCLWLKAACQYRELAAVIDEDRLSASLHQTSEVCVERANRLKHPPGEKHE